MRSVMEDCRLVGAREAMRLLNMSRTSFYRNIKRGIIPKQRYIGSTPVWRLSDLQRLFDQLPEEPSADALSSSK